MPNCSRFEKSQKKILVFVAKKLIEDGEFDYENPYDGSGDGLGELSSVLKYFGDSSVSDQDLEFFAKFIELNLNHLTSEESEKMYYENLIIPTCSTFEIQYELDVRLNKTEEYSDTWDSYDKNWVWDSVHQALSDGNWDYYSGTLLSEDIYDSETDGFEIKQVSEKIQERINSLDKKTLLEIKKLIDKKLKS